MRYFEEVEVGEEVTFQDEYPVTEEEIMEVGRRWDPQPFHTDPEAAKDSLFGGLVASSAHIFAIYVSLGYDEADKDVHMRAVSALGFDKLQWHAPVRPGDVLKSRYKVIEKRVSNSRPQYGIVRSNTEVFNQRSEIVFTLQCAFLVERLPQGED